MRKIFSLLAIAIVFTGWSAFAAEHSVSQKGKKFGPKKLSIAVGDVVKFVNDDSITHNVHSKAKGDKFDLGPQAEGTTISHTFDKAGKYKIRCAIHPKMKLTIVVE